jgi:hypothetical protein
VIELLRRLHRWAEDRMRPRTARAAAAIVALAACAAIAWPAFGVANDLASQQAGIRAALGRCSAAERDPAAMQLISQATVSANGRTYGGPRALARPLDLFEDDGSMSEDTKAELAWRLVADQVPAWLPSVLARSPSTVLALAASAAGALALAAWLGFMLQVLEVGVPVVGAALALWAAGWQAGAQWVAAAAASLLLFAFLWRAARAALFGRGGPIAVASNTALEGVRSLAAPGFALPIAMVLPMLALSRGPQDPLFQAIPGFLDWGHTATFAFAAVFVLFFGCASTAGEMRDRQVWSVVTKPVSAASWMLGKWLGTLALGAAVALGGMLLIAAGTVYLASQRPVDEQDARDVRTAVLVARTGTRPEYEVIPAPRLAEIVNETIERDAVLKADIANGTVDEAAQRRAIAEASQKEFLEGQRRIGPGDSREFTFRGLQDAVRAGLPVALRFKLHGGGDDEHERFTTMFQWTSGEGSGMWETREWVPGDAYSLRVEPRFVGPDGTLRVRLWNLRMEEGAKEPVANTITVFVQPDSLEVMVTESTFAGNLARALVVDVAKLAFLAALATVAGSFLSFPIAVLLAFGVFSMASLTPFLATSIDNWYIDPKTGAVAAAAQRAVLAVASSIEWALGGFAAQSPSDALAQGRVIRGITLFQAVGGIGLAWTAGTLLFGWAVMRRKEVAVYSGQS